MNKEMFGRLALAAVIVGVAWMMLFGFGCVGPQNQTANGTVNGNGTGTTQQSAKLVFFYDPVQKGVDELITLTKAHLPGLNVDMRCVDYTKIIYNQESQSSQTCINKDGEETFNKNMNDFVSLLKENKSSSAFVYADGEYSSVVVEMNPLLFAKEICSVHSFDGCGGLPQSAETVSGKVYGRLESDEQLYGSLTGDMKANGGLELSIEPVVVDDSNVDEVRSLVEGIEYLPVLVLEPTDEDSKFVIRQYVDQIGQGKSSLNAVEKDGKFIFYPSYFDNMSYYIGVEPIVNATLYVKEGDTGNYAQMFEQIIGSITPIKVEVVEVSDDEEQNVSDELGQDFLPVLVIDESRLSDTQKSKFDSYAGKEVIPGSGVLLSKSDGKYFASSKVAEPFSYIGGKVDKVVFDLYVMSHCPYGAQMQKALIPVVELFNGTDKFEVNNKFVYYTMHGPQEVQDNLIEYCVGKEYPEKEWAFIRCFVESSGDSSTCEQNLDINSSEIDSCIENAKSEFGITLQGTDFPIYAEENTLYGVRGSPTLVFDGKQLAMQRDPEVIKNFVCSVLAEPPEDLCNTTLDYTIVPGFGPVNSEGGSYTGGSGSCG